jgi:hypothetical protein
MQSSQWSRSRLIAVWLAFASLVAPKWGTRVLWAHDSTQSQYVEPRLFVGDIRELPTILPCDITDLACESSVLKPSELSSTLAEFGQDAFFVKRASTSAAVTGFTTFPNFPGQQATGIIAVPPDTVGDVGPNHYIQVVNYDVTSPGCMNPHGTVIMIYDKTGTPISGPTVLASMWTECGACRDDTNGDPIVLYDQLAQRWLLAEFDSAGSHVCVYVSRNSDPVTGGWYLYPFSSMPPMGSQFDFMKYGVWTDAYYMGSATDHPDVYAFDRSRMLGGQAARQPKHREVAALPGTFFHSLPPADLDGTALPPAGSPAFFVRHRDDELTGPEPVDPTRDYLELFEFVVDWDETDTDETDFSLRASIPVAEFDSELCGLHPNLTCLPQPGTTTRLNPMRHQTMWRLQYRNRGPHQSIVGNFVTDLDGTDHAGIRWFELRRVGEGPWSLFQEGTWAGQPPDVHNRWLGSIAMDRSGNIALGYNLVSTTVSPSILWVGRTHSDPPGVMSTGESFIWAGQYYSSDGRWGDYSSMNVDPVDDCTFWFTTEHARIDHRWATRIARFRFDSPTCVNAVAPTCSGNCVRIDPVADATVTKLSPMEEYGTATTPNVGRGTMAKGVPY